MVQHFTLNNGSCCMVIENPGGMYHAEQLSQLSEFCQKHSLITKITEDQCLAVFVKEEQIAQLAESLKEMGLGLRDYQHGIHNPVNCLGALCPFSQHDAAQGSIEIAQQLEQIELEVPLKIGINDCYRRCTPTQTLDISVMGEEQGYSVFLGGQSQEPARIAVKFAQGIPQDELAKCVRNIVELYIQHHQSDEGLFECVLRVGVEVFLDSLQPFSADLIESVNKSFGKEASAPETQDDSIDEHHDKTLDFEQSEENILDLDLQDDDDESHYLSHGDIDIDEYLSHEHSDEDEYEELEIEGVEPFEQGSSQTQEHDMQDNSDQVVNLPHNSSVSGQEWALESVELIPNNEVQISFSNGSQLQIQLDKIGEQLSLRFGNQILQVEQSSKDVWISFGALKLSLPAVA